MSDERGKRGLSPVVGTRETGNYPTAIVQANKRMNRILLATLCFMFAYGVLLPVEWEILFGALGNPIRLLADMIPSTKQLEEISSIPTLVSGFMGSGTIVAVLAALLLAFTDPIGERVSYALTMSSVSHVKILIRVYFLVIPTLIFFLWFVFFLPIPIDPSGGYTWGYKTLLSMIKSRVALAFWGSIIVTSVELFFFLLIAAILAPFYICLGRKNKC